ncbi:YifB family Mg chelatase-like AAA ATPase [Clostridium hydrogeniformans]|uniref:YifB family Mg chelatase-like AAA ATPase n=1 Tax=Clostridium hydrogeniformans TaxID=349933 RepID=UPI000481C5AA|nr:YifB family Mg chelatase-like AAA ATPase [Clostridium hydrogeniformans]
MAINLNSATIRGIEGEMVRVEVDIVRSLPSFTIVGLPDTTVKESKERVRSAIINSGFEFPLGRIIVNLAPGNLKKEGTYFDLPIALAILRITEQIQGFNEEEFIILGELSLNGELRGVKGILPIVIESSNNGFKNFIVPYDNVKECSIIKNTKVYAFENLKEVIGFLTYRDVMPYSIKEDKVNIRNLGDFQEVIGQESVKRALEVACAGGHSVILYGEPGTGKSMLANRIPSILPELSYEESLEVTKIYSVCGILNKNNGLVKERPFRRPHHTTSNITLVGGGRDLRPGEITLAHNGVLYLDEILEFKKDVLEVLRQPLEERSITVSRLSGTVEYPASFILIGSMNPCICGMALSNSPYKRCSCTEREKNRYIKKLSGPLLDRIDMFIFVPPVNIEELNGGGSLGETSKEIRKRVEKARKKQRERFKKENIYCNSEMNHRHIRNLGEINKGALNILDKIYLKYNISPRVYDKLIKLSRTIADLDNSDSIKEGHIIEAIQYRKFINEEII